MCTIISILLLLNKTLSDLTAASHGLSSTISASETLLCLNRLTFLSVRKIALNFVSAKASGHTSLLLHILIIVMNIWWYDTDTHAIKHLATSIRCGDHVHVHGESKILLLTPDRLRRKYGRLTGQKTLFELHIPGLHFECLAARLC